MTWIGAVVQVLIKIMRAIWGTSAPRQSMVTHAKQEVEINDGKTDEERMHDLGL